MKRIMILGLSLLMALFIACEDKKDDAVVEESTVITVTTGNVNDGSFYYNLTIAAEDTNTWHVSLQNIDAGGGYYMPSIVLNNSVMVTIDTSVNFDELEEIPSNDQWSTDISIVAYGGDNEVLNYDQTNHTISVSNDNILIYIPTTHQVFKLHFDEYSDGIVLFQFDEMTQ